MVHAHVRLQVALLLSLVRAEGTLEARLLVALVPDMLDDVLLPLVGASTFSASKAVTAVHSFIYKVVWMFCKVWLNIKELMINLERYKVNKVDKY